MHGPLSFIVFWVVALAAGAAFVLLLVVGGGWAWLLLAVPGLALGLLLVFPLGRDRR